MPKRGVVGVLIDIASIASIPFLIVLAYILDAGIFMYRKVRAAYYAYKRRK